MMIVVDIILLTLVVATGYAVTRLQSLFSAAMMSSIYSLLMAAVWYNMHAMDVAFTEAAVGAGITTALLIATIVYTGRDEKPRTGVHLPALVVCLALGGLLAYGVQDMPAFGDPDAPIHAHVSPQYIDQSVGSGKRYGDMKRYVPNQVTAVLADYRGYDTMFEAAVIFTAGIALILLRGRPRQRGRFYRGHVSDA